MRKFKARHHLMQLNSKNPTFRLGLNSILHPYTAKPVQKPAVRRVQLTQ